MSKKTSLNLSFAGCGFLGLYHVGVSACLKKYAPNVYVSKASGASAGAIAACCILCDAPLGQVTKDVLRIATLARSKTLGPFSPSFNINKILRDGLQKVLPEDAHIRCSGRLHISLTRVYDRQNVIVSHFNSRDDLIQAIVCSTFIPIFSGIIPPVYRGERYLDGGFTDNSPAFDAHTVTVNPFCGEADICPLDDTNHLFHVNLSNTSIELSMKNLIRFSGTLYPPKPEILFKMCQQGFDDTLRFLARNDLIGCSSCMEPKMEPLEEELEMMATKNYAKIMSEESSCCHQCKVKKEVALLDSLPDTVVSILQDAIETGNKGLFNWLFSHHSVKILSLLSLPCILSADIAYALCVKVLENAPTLTYTLGTFSTAVIHLLAQSLTRFNFAPGYYAKLSCKLDFTEYTDEMDFEAPFDFSFSRRQSIKNQVNFGFTLNIDNGDSVQLLSNYTVSRRPSLCEVEEEGEDDTFERYLSVTSHHEAVMANYYLNQDKLEITEIYSGPLPAHMTLPPSTIVEL